MTWAPLIVVAVVIIWLRFRLGAGLRRALWALTVLALEEHGTKRLFNGQPAKPVYRPGMNRHARRSAKYTQ